MEQNTTRALAGAIVKADQEETGLWDSGHTWGMIHAAAIVTGISAFTIRAAVTDPASQSLPFLEAVAALTAVLAPEPAYRSYE